MAQAVSALELWRGLWAGSIPAVIDLRNPDDQAAAPFEGRPGRAVISAPLWRVLDAPEALAATAPDGSAALCALGHGAEMVADLLAEHGRQVVFAEGGMAEWGALLVPEALELPGGGPLRVWQVLRPAKGCLSYVIGLPGAAAVVVDPARHPDPYLELLAMAGMHAVAVVDTHLHADHISGGPALAHATGAPYLLPEAEAPGRDDRAGGPPPASVVLSAEYQVELLRLALPGHTPGTTALAVPGVFLMAGDTILPGGVGRPDLTGQADALARELYRSIHERLAGMPPETVLLPAHWSRADDIGPDGTVKSRLGDVLVADQLAGMDVEGFVAAVTASLPPAPASYDRIRAVNAGSPADPDELDGLDVGRNQCGASVLRPGAG